VDKLITRERLLSCALYALSTAPVIALLFFIHTIAAPVIFMEQVDVLPIHDQSIIAFLFKPLNEHLLVMPKLFINSLRLIGIWNFHTHHYIAVVLSLINTLLIFKLAFKTHSHLLRHHFALLFCTTLFFAIETQFAFINRTYGNLLVTTFFLCGLHCAFIKKKTLYHIFCAALCCVLATLSFGNGFITWLALFPLIIFQYRKGIAVNISWLFATIATSGVVFGISNSSESLASKLSIDFITDFLQFFLLIVGHPLIFGSIIETEIAGVLLIVLSILLTYLVIRVLPKHNLSAALPWLCILIYSLGSAIIIALGRSHEAIELAFRPSYMCISYLAGIAALYLLWLIIPRNKLLNTLTVCMIISSTFSIAKYIPKQITRYAKIHQGYACLQHYKTASTTCLYNLYRYNPVSLKQIAPKLIKMELLSILEISNEINWQQKFKLTMGEITRLIKEDNQWNKEEIVITGWAQVTDCSKAPSIIFTYGESKEILSHTVAVMPMNQMYDPSRQCRTDVGWEAYIPTDVLPNSYELNSLRSWVLNQSNNELIELQISHLRTT